MCVCVYVKQGNSDEDTSVVVVKTNGFRAYNINFNQTFGLAFDGPQAVAVTVDADQTVFDQCLFTGYQDTLFVGNTTWTGRQYFKESYIAGGLYTLFLLSYYYYTLLRSRIDNQYFGKKIITIEIPLN